MWGAALTRLLALDLGTTSFKAIVYDGDGNKLSEARAKPPDRRIEISGSPVDIWEPEALWLTAGELLRQAVEPFNGEVNAVAIAQLGLIGVPLDDVNEPIYPFVTWLDPGACASEILARSGLEDTSLFVRCGNRLNSIYPPAWIGWMAEHEPQFAEGMRRWVFVGDWLAYLLCGELASDYSITSQTLVLDQRELVLRDDLLEAFGLPDDLFVAPGPAGRRLGAIGAQAARMTKLRTGIPVIVGGADWLVGVLGGGLTEPGDVGILTGTWELTFTCLADPCLTSLACQSGAICDPHVVPDRWVLRIEALSGEVTEWYRQQLPADRMSTSGMDGWSKLIAACAAVEPGSGGLVFIPHLFGSYGPRHDALARGAFIGLTGATTRATMGRAVFEGLSFQTRASLDALSAASDVQPERVVVMGGGVKNELWLQTRADVLGRSIEAVEDPDVTPRGAAMLAALGIDAVSDYHEAVARFAPPTITIEPDVNRARLYEQMYREAYLPLQDSLEAINHRLAEIADGGSAP